MLDKKYIKYCESLKNFKVLKNIILSSKETLIMLPGDSNKSKVSKLLGLQTALVYRACMTLSAENNNNLFKPFMPLLL